MQTFIVPQTGNELQFTSIEAARLMMNINFMNRTDAVIFEEATEGDKVTFAYKNTERKIIFYAKQK